MYQEQKVAALPSPTQPKQRLVKEAENEEEEEEEEAVAEEQQQQLVNRNDSMKPRCGALHPLRYCWIFWHYRRSKRTTKNWMDCQRVLAELDTLESFWHFFVQLQNPSMAKINQDYALFKRGIEPMWEDPHNVKGGQWIFVIQKSHDNYRSLVDHVWDEIVLALVCAIFASPIMELVCGVVFSMRISCFTKISVWLSDYAAVTEVLALGHELKRLTDFEDCVIFRRNDDMKVKFIL